MTPQALDRLDELMAEDERNGVRPECASKVMLTRAEMDRYNAWCDRDTILAREARTAIPTLVAEVRRLRSGVEQLTILLAAHETMPTAHSWHRATECMARLLAGREWSDNGR